MTIGAATAQVAADAGRQGAPAKPPAVGSSSQREAPATAATPTPADYVIGPEDVLVIVFWGEKELSAEVVVRPDGKISLPLLKDIEVAGLTPRTAHRGAGQERLEVCRTAECQRHRQGNPQPQGVRGRPGRQARHIPLVGDTTVLQLIAQAGDVLEYAKAKDIVVVRKEGTREQRFKFNYRDVLKGKHAEQNILLKPGDTVIVP